MRQTEPDMTTDRNTAFGRRRATDAVGMSSGKLPLCECLRTSGGYTFSSANHGAPGPSWETILGRLAGARHARPFAGGRRCCFKLSSARRRAHGSRASDFLQAGVQAAASRVTAPRCQQIRKRRYVGRTSSRPPIWWRCNPTCAMTGISS